MTDPIFPINLNEATAPTAIEVQPTAPSPELSTQDILLQVLQALKASSNPQVVQATQTAIPVQSENTTSVRKGDIVIVRVQGTHQVLERPAVVTRVHSYSNVNAVVLGHYASPGEFGGLTYSSHKQPNTFCLLDEQDMSTQQE